MNLPEIDGHLVYFILAVAFAFPIVAVATVEICRFAAIEDWGETDLRERGREPYPFVVGATVRTMASLAALFGFLEYLCKLLLAFDSEISGDFFNWPQVICVYHATMVLKTVAMDLTRQRYRIGFLLVSFVPYALAMLNLYVVVGQKYQYMFSLIQLPVNVTIVASVFARLHGRPPKGDLQKGLIDRVDRQWRYSVSHVMGAVCFATGFHCAAVALAWRDEGVWAELAMGISQLAYLGLIYAQHQGL